MHGNQDDAIVVAMSAAGVPGLRPPSRMFRRIPRPLARNAIPQNECDGEILFHKVLTVAGLLAQLHLVRSMEAGQHMKLFSKGSAQRMFFVRRLRSAVGRKIPISNLREILAVIKQLIQTV